jgi:hypothetical protein
MSRRRRPLKNATKFIKSHKWASTAVAAGVLLIAAAFIPWGGGGSDESAHPAPTARPTIDNGLFDPGETGGLKVGAKSGTSQDFAPGEKPFGTGDGDAFGVSNTDNKLHTVTVSATSDGAMSIGYRFRGGNGDGFKVAGKTFSFTTKVRGGLPVTQIGVQILSNATYAACSITIDGVVTTTGKTTKGPGYVVVCTG